MTDQPTTGSTPQQEPPATGPTRIRQVPPARVNHLARALSYLREGDEIGPEQIGPTDAIAEVYALRAIAHGMVTLGGETRLSSQIAYLSILVVRGDGSPSTKAKIDRLEQLIDGSLGLDQ